MARASPGVGAVRDVNAASPRPRTIPTDLAALATGVTEATVRKWLSRGKLTRYGRPGKAEYDLDELSVLAAARARRG